MMNMEDVYRFSYKRGGIRWERVSSQEVYELERKFDLDGAIPTFFVEDGIEEDLGFKRIEEGIEEMKRHSSRN